MTYKMKKLSIAPISDSAKMPIKKGTLQFLQDANSEVFAAIVQSLIGDNYNPSTVYVLRGCENTGTDPSYLISEGNVFYNGEVFAVDATSFSTSGNVAIFQIATTQYTTFADPVTFSDNTTHNVHDIRKVQVLSGTSGSGIADWTQLVRLNFVIPPQLNATGAGVSGVYPNLVFAGPNGINPCLGGGSFTIGDIPAGGQTYTVTFPTTMGTAGNVGTSSFFVLMTLLTTNLSDLRHENMIRHPLLLSRSNTGFTFFIDEDDNITQQLTLEYMIFAK